MLRSETLFGKRDTTTTSTGGNTGGAVTPGNQGMAGGSNLSGTASGAAGSGGVARIVGGAGAAAKAGLGADSGGARDGGSRMLVGPQIKLKGMEIRDCEILEVEGTIDAAAVHSRRIEIAECGVVKGMATVDVAEVFGVFDGELTVRQKLAVRATGRVSGKIRYAKLVVDEGGQLSGDVHTLGSPAQEEAGTVAEQDGAAAVAGASPSPSEL